MLPDPMTEEPLHGWLSGRWWDDEVTDMPQNGTTEQWQIINLTGDAHPIHLHLTQFQVVNRQNLAADADGIPLYAGYYPLRDIATPPSIAQPVPRAAVPGGRPRRPPERRSPTKPAGHRICPPGQVTRILAPWDAKPEWFTNGEARYVWHCHILDHEDNEMMRPMIVKQ